jgi:Mrp family chromosome partitioning ATPase
MKVATKRLSPSKSKVRQRSYLKARRKMRKTPPHTVAIASTKGGSGKSSITAALAIQAAKEGKQGRSGDPGAYYQMLTHKRAVDCKRIEIATRIAALVGPTQME